MLTDHSEWGPDRQVTACAVKRGLRCRLKVSLPLQCPLSGTGFGPLMNQMELGVEPKSYKKSSLRVDLLLRVARFVAPEEAA